jgi:hypothetical protein
MVIAASPLCGGIEGLVSNVTASGHDLLSVAQGSSDRWHLNSATSDVGALLHGLSSGCSQPDLCGSAASDGGGVEAGRGGRLDSDL